jgi:hypothetical protein
MLARDDESIESESDLNVAQSSAAESQTSQETSHSQESSGYQHSMSQTELLLSNPVNIRASSPNLSTMEQDLPLQMLFTQVVHIPNFYPVFVIHSVMKYTAIIFGCGGIIFIHRSQCITGDYISRIIMRGCDCYTSYYISEDTLDSVRSFYGFNNLTFDDAIGIQTTTATLTFDEISGTGPVEASHKQDSSEVEDSSNDDISMAKRPRVNGEDIGHCFVDNISSVIAND